MAFLTLDEYRKKREEEAAKGVQPETGAQRTQGNRSGFLTIGEYKKRWERGMTAGADTPALPKETVWQNSGFSRLQEDFDRFQTDMQGTKRGQSDDQYQGIAQRLYEGTQQVWDYLRENQGSFTDEELEGVRSTLQGYRQELQARSSELSKSEMLQLATEKSNLQKRVEAQQKAAEDGQWWSEQENAQLQKDLQDYLQRAYDVGSRMSGNGLLEQGNWKNIWGSLYDFGAGAGQTMGNLASYYKSYYGAEGSAQEREQAGKENLTFMTEYRRRTQAAAQSGLSPTQWYEKAKKDYEKAEKATGGWTTDKGHSQVWMDRIASEYAYASFYAKEMMQHEVSKKSDFGELSKPDAEALQGAALKDSTHSTDMDEDLSLLFSAVNRGEILELRDEHIRTYSGMRDWNGIMQSEVSYSESGFMPYGINFERASYMKQEERDTFNYLVNTGATTEAKQYIQALMPYLKERAIQGNKEKWDEMSGADRVFMSFISGLDNSMHFMQNWMTDEGYNADYNAGMSLNMAEAGRVERAFRGAASSLGSMLPSMAVGAATGGMGSALTTLATAGGSARQQGLKQGMTGTQATVYGLLCGASEGGLQWLMSGIPGLKGALPEKLGENLAQNFSNVLARSAVKWAGNVGSELLEENVQNYLEPLFVSIVTNKEYEAPGWEEFLDTSLSVLILSGTMSGVEAMTNVGNEIAQAQEQWAELALNFPEDSAIHDAGLIVKRSLMDGTILSRSDWQSMLQTLGADAKTMNQLRKGKLTTQQAAKIFGQRTMLAEELEQIRREGTEAAVSASVSTGDSSLEKGDRGAVVTGGAEAIPQSPAATAPFTQGSFMGTAADGAQIMEGVGEDGRTEGFDDGSQRNEGLGAREQAGAVEEGAGRSVSRDERAAQAAVLSHLKENGRAQSAKEIGVEDGGEEQSLYVLQESDIAQSAQWKRIQENAQADGARVVFFAGNLKVYNPVKKEYSKVEGIHQVAADGTVTYYIKADKLSRDAEQIYLHEKFHNIVHNNPELLGDLVLSLELEYGRQEILRLVSRYVEAFDGIYGTFEEGMSEEKENALIMRYIE